jgi:hypothetical protein
LRYSQRKSPICNRKSLAGKFSQEQATINIPAAGSPVEEGTVIVQPVVEADDPLLETVFACPEPCRRALPPEEPKAAPVAAETVFGAPSLAAINEAWQANSLAAVPPLAEPDGINWGAGALAAAAGMSAYYLSKRREEEEAQRRAVREQVAAKNDALRAKEAQQREQAKIENYLQGKAMLEAQLASSDLSDAEKAEIRDRLKAEGVASAMGLTTEKAIAQHEREAQAQQAKREFELAWLLQADKSESERHAEYINSDEYKAYQAGLLTWHVEQEKKKQAEEDERQKQAEYATNQAYAALREQGQSITVAAPIGSILSQPNHGAYKLASPVQQSLDENPSLWNYIKGDIFQGLSDIKETISNTTAGVFQNIKDVGNQVGASVSDIWSGKSTTSQAWNDIVTASQTAQSNSVNLMAQGKKEIGEIYSHTTDVVLHKTAGWLDNKRNPVYDLFVYGLEGISKQKLVDTREVVFSSFPVNVTKEWLGMPDYMELSATIAGGYTAGLVQGVDMVVLPGKDERNMEYKQPDSNSFAFFHSPGVQGTLPGANAVACSGYGYMNNADYTIEDYKGPVGNVGAGGFFPVIPIGGNIEVYHSLSPDVSQKMISDVAKEMNVYPGYELSWDIAEKLADGRILPSHYGPLSPPDKAVWGYRVCLGAGTPGSDAHVSITDAEYINIFGHEMKYDNVPTPIINAIIDFMETSPKDWQW